MAKKVDKKFQLETKYNRTFSEAFRRSKVKEISNGQIRVRDVCRLYDISRASVYKWIHLYSDVEKGVKTVVQMESESHKTKLLQERIAELERIVGRKQMEIDYLNVCLEVASEEVGYDIKKKHEQPRSNVSDNKQQKDIQ
ncbi:MAG: transposase [Candidatus Omnitrophica bacterium]|jgi:transposase|nr:transposase [Candidatus Omnitrophota bacterium]